MHTRPRLRHHANPEKPTRSGLLSYETLNAGQATLTTDQKVGSSNLSGRAGQVPRFGGDLLVLATNQTSKSNPPPNR